MLELYDIQAPVKATLKAGQSYRIDHLLKAYNDGLRAGIAADVTIAHKFGETVDKDGSPFRYLNDCGIVYLPDHPYLICIATRGTDPARQSEVIREVSQLAFDIMKSFYLE